jgi:hypothetical protein
MPEEKKDITNPNAAEGAANAEENKPGTQAAQGEAGEAEEDSAGAGQSAAGENAEDNADKDGESKAQKPAAPEAYAEFKVPEGYAIKKETGDKFAALAKKANLTQEAAQEFIDLQTAHQQEINADFKKITDDWEAKTIKMLGADKDGKLTPEGEKKLARAKAAALAAGGQEAVDILDATCAGKHEAVLKVLLTLAPHVLEDEMNIDGKSPTPTKSDGDLFYGKTMKK